MTEKKSSLEILRSRNNREKADAWLDRIAPGCYFLRHDEESPLVLYGKVLDFLEPKDGTVPTLCMARGIQDWFVLTPLWTISMLLSQEQFDLAKQLDWPTDEAGLTRVFEVSAD